MAILKRKNTAKNLPADQVEQLGAPTVPEATASDTQPAEAAPAAPDAPEPAGVKPAARPTLEGEAARKQGKRGQSRRDKRAAKRADKRAAKGVVRIQDLEDLIEREGIENIDPETAVSMYLPKRRMQRIGAALLRMDKLQKALIALALLFGLLFALSFMQENMGNFTINLNRLELFRYGVAIDEDPNFGQATARLQAQAVTNGTNIATEDLPDDLDQIDGSHNGKNYVAYTFYIRNAGKVDLNYSCNVRVASASKGVEKAARVKIWKNGEPTVYAAAAADGNPEPGCVSFESDKVVCTIPEENFQVGNVDKYTVVIWLDGDDPECVDDIVGGAVEFAMDFETLDEDNSGLVVKFVRDIVDTLTGNDPISASGNDAPDYYKDHDVTWDNRRNQENSPAA